MKTNIKYGNIQPKSRSDKKYRQSASFLKNDGDSTSFKTFRSWDIAVNIFVFM